VAHGGVVIDIACPFAVEPIYGPAEEELQSIDDGALPFSIAGANKEVPALQITGVVGEPPEAAELDLPELLTHSSWPHPRIAAR